MYEDNVVIDKSLVLVGSSQESTIVSPAVPGEDVFHITAPNVQVSGFRIEDTGSAGGTPSAGIGISGAHSVNVSNNTVENDQSGLAWSILITISFLTIPSFQVQIMAFTQSSRISILLTEQRYPKQNRNIHE